MFRPTVIVAGCLTAVFTLTVAAQQPQPGQKPPVFRSTVDLVNLDVSVLDKDRHPVRGLTDKDFTITEDDKPQDIVAFTAVDVPENPPKPAAWSGRAPADVQSNEGAADPEGRLFVLLIDDAMIPPDPPSLETARRVSKKFLDMVTPADRVAVVFSESGRNQNFTNDRARLVQAIDSLKVGFAQHLGGWDTAPDPVPPTTGFALKPTAPGPLTDPDVILRQASMQTLRQVAETLISAPQRRKALVLVSPGIGIDVSSSAVPVSTQSLSGDNVTLPAGSPKDLPARMSLVDANRQLAQDLPQLYLRMQRANVTIYPVDPCGADGFQSYVLRAAASVPLLQMDSGPLPTGFNFLYPGAGVPTPAELAKHMSTLSMDFLVATASNTGGRPIVNTNDFDAGLQQIFEENSSYYLLGYQQPTGQPPGSQHRISVKVNRPGVIVRTRSGYATPDAPKKKNANAEPLSPLDKAIVNAVPDGSFPMRVALAPFMVPGKKDPVVTIALGLTQPPVSSRSILAVDVQTNAYTADGRPKFIGQRHTATVTLVPTAHKDVAHYDLLTQISLPPGLYQLRLSANRQSDGVSGSLYADLEVPDFSAALSASGVVVETVPSGAAAPIGAFDQFLPVVPSTNREFSKTQDVTAFIRIYQGGTKSIQPVQVKTRIVNEADAPVGTGKDMVYGTDFRVGGRAADYRFAIPVKTLPPGLYLLTFEIGLDKDVVSRAVQFRITK